MLHYGGACLVREMYPGNENGEGAFNRTRVAPGLDYGHS